MAFFSRLSPHRNRNNQSFKEPFWQGFTTPAKSGQSVTAQSALQVSAVFACLRVISEGVAQIPCKTFRERPDGGSDVAKELPLYKLLYRRPNRWQTSFEFRENLVFQVALAGDFFAFKNIVRGQLKELIPLDPGSVTVDRSSNGTLTYRIHAQSATTNGEAYSTQSVFMEEKEFPAESIWHVRGPSWNTWMGLPAVTIARESIGLSIATEESQSLFHANGGQTSGMYSITGTLNDTQHKELSKWVEKHISGLNKFKPLILDREAKFNPTTMNGVDSQLIETRRFQIEEVCRAFRVMPIMIGHPDKTATYASAEQMFLAHVVHTLSPWYKRIEDSANVNLLTEQEQNADCYVKFITNALMRGAAKDRVEYYWKMWQMGNLNNNEMRALEEYNPREGGDEYFVPANMILSDGTQSGGQLVGSQPNPKDPGNA